MIIFLFGVGEFSLHKIGKLESVVYRSHRNQVLKTVSSDSFIFCTHISSQTFTFGNKCSHTVLKTEDTDQLNTHGQMYVSIHDSWH